MARICRNIIEQVEETVWDKIENWVSKRQKKCKERKWPLNWFCWFVTFLIKVVTWVSRTVWIFVTRVVCEIISLIIYPFAIAIASVIDAFCIRCNALDNVNSVFGSEGKCKLEKKIPSTIKPNQFEYHFICKCDKKNSKFTITAPNDEIAAELARSQKLKKCGIKTKVTLEEIELIQNPLMIKYFFTCNCSSNKNPIEFNLTLPIGMSIEEVKKKAKKECNKLC